MNTSEKILGFRIAPLAPRVELGMGVCGMPDVLMGPSASMARLWSQVRRVAPYFRTALLVGERGAGTEAVAQVLHSLSPLRAHSFTVMTAQEAESSMAPGMAAGLQNHTLFVPDIERLSAQAQQGVLRALQLRRSRRVNVIAAATGELRPLVSAGQFSGLLAASLGALQIAVPPLRERAEDLPGLAMRVLTGEAKAAGITMPLIDAEFLKELAEFAWPGNLLQLQVALRRLVDQPELTAKELLDASQTDPETPAELVRLMKLEHVVQEHIRGVLLRCHGNKLRAAEVLGISRSTLYRMLDAGTVFQKAA